MNKGKSITTEKVPVEKEPKLVAEDMDESIQEIEEAAYYVGLNRGRNSHPGDEVSDWLEAEKAVREDQ